MKYISLMGQVLAKCFLQLTFVLLFTSVFGLPASAAQSDVVLLRTDKEFYVTGEIIWYQIFLPAAFSGHERVIHTIVSDAEGRVLTQHYHKTNGETSVSGYYNVPFDLRTGYYRLAFYAVHQQAGGNLYLGKLDVPVYNDFESLRTVEIQAEKPQAREAFRVDTLNVSITPSPSELPVRTHGTLDIMVTEAQGEPVESIVSVAVTDARMTVGAQLHMGASVTTAQVAELARTPVIKGVLHDAGGNPLQVNVLGVFFPRTQRFTYAKSGHDGTFTVALPDFTGAQPVQIINYPEETKFLRATLSDEVRAERIEQEIVYTEEIIEYLTLSRKRKKILQYFTTVEQNIRPVEITPDIQVLKPDFRYVMAEYEPFEDIGAFFTELITPLRFTFRESTYRARMENPRGRTLAQTQLSGEPLFIIDGRATRNADYVARIDLSLVENVDLYFIPANLRQYFQAMGRSGVVIIRTKLPFRDLPEDDRRNMFNIHGLQAPAAFPAIGRADADNRGIPLIRPVLYWEPSAHTDRNGRAQVQYYQSDDLTQYRVQVFVQSADGRRGMAEVVYSTGI